MKVEIIRIGNSRGVRLPKALLEQCGFADSAELLVEKGRLVLVPTAQVRAGWLERFAQSTDGQQAEDLSYLLPDTTNIEWDDAEWHW
ncbi:MAG: AbrB/MazE/SpoVT family DNA-binding domain-containing protein [Gemmatimonadaceae bacterium]|nr:AbrB/MazE/SpoVT family DNA-binding domain-containing protein [Gloeobacterales cyanobacterium ES-bin-141]